MIRISLTPEEMSALTQLRLHRKSNIGERAYYVLLAGEGHSPPAIAKQLGRNIITIRLWLNRYIAGGISALSSKKQSGRPAKKAAYIESQLELLLSHSPSDYGYQEAGWQINLLKDWFSKQNCSACHNTIIKALRKKGYVYKRFSKTMPSNAPSAADKQRSISEIVSQIEAQAVEHDVEVLFGDESHFSNQPYVARGWFKRGEKKRSPPKKID